MKREEGREERRNTEDGKWKREDGGRGRLLHKLREVKKDVEEVNVGTKRKKRGTKEGRERKNEEMDRGKEEDIADEEDKDEEDKEDEETEEDQVKEDEDKKDRRRRRGR